MWQSVLLGTVRYDMPSLSLWSHGVWSNGEEMKESLKSKMETDLHKITLKLERAREKAETVNAAVQELERQQYALQSALDVLEFRGPVVPQDNPDFGPGGPPNILPAIAPAAKLPPNTVLLNGEPVVLEQGWTVGKTEQGEEVLVPPVLPRSDQSRPVAPPVILPPIGSDDGFASDLPGGM